MTLRGAARRTPDSFGRAPNEPGVPGEDDGIILRQSATLRMRLLGGVDLRYGGVSAVDRYTGDFLDGRYDEWLLEERRGLRERYLHALRTLAHRLEAHDDHVAAIRYAEVVGRLGGTILLCKPHAWRG